MSNKINFCSVTVYFFMIFISCTNNQQKISIVPLPLLTTIDTSRSLSAYTYCSDIFLVKGFVENKTTEKFIDSFCLKQELPNKRKYNSYHVVFYKESIETNEANILKNPRVVVRYSESHDMIFIYEWDNGNFIVREKFKDGEMVEPDIKNIEIKEINK